MTNLNILQQQVLGENERDRFREESRHTPILPLLQWPSQTSKFFLTPRVSRDRFVVVSTLTAFFANFLKSKINDQNFF